MRYIRFELGKHSFSGSFHSQKIQLFARLTVFNSNSQFKCLGTTSTLIFKLNHNLNWISSWCQVEMVWILVCWEVTISKIPYLTYYIDSERNIQHQFKVHKVAPLFFLSIDSALFAKIEFTDNHVSNGLLNLRWLERVVRIEPNIVEIVVSHELPCLKKSWGRSECIPVSMVDILMVIWRLDRWNWSPRRDSHRAIDLALQQLYVGENLISSNSRIIVGCSSDLELNAILSILIELVFQVHSFSIVSIGP